MNECCNKNSDADCTRWRLSRAITRREDGRRRFPRSVQSPSAVRVEPSQHEQAAGGKPTSRDANDEQSPLPGKGYDERREARNDDEDGDS